ncbi:MAG: TetR/AcrR family transcriptional regulator [Muribaculaceae bacterium]|nr:TetR/AcrR family transcriptional regulator [Bacteroidales bacterium]MDD6942615.1 TetR/AcrR family transcriptional regulator [Bacteroidales bacterium]MDY2734040.1 TetR/AcrR family transcriptional regulator [Muribaculaceae bacterium]MDY4649376.1 TetR/AcrR family transcriptional regulator [Muribaculaceae bacterium]MDY5388492.1 TetR/AcrR family transcriptional regulator [Muribaculaceae bacterium]
MVKKTRDRFIEVARSLFARKGVENTTMNDIATASDKGRRTIYTYFKSKREIFNAVIESESDDLLQNLNSIVTKLASPEQKLREYVATRMETMRQIVSRNGSLRAGFFRDVRKVDRARSVISKKEIKMLMHILHEGVVLGVFDIPNIKEWAIIITNSINGFDVPYIRNSLTEYGIDKQDMARMIADLVLNGIRVRDNEI